MYMYVYICIYISLYYMFLKFDRLELLLRDIYKYKKHNKMVKLQI